MQNSEEAFEQAWATTLQLADLMGWHERARKIAHDTGQELITLQNAGVLVQVAKNPIGMRTLHTCIELRVEKGLNGSVPGVFSCG